MSGFSKAIESILKSFGKQAQKQAEEKAQKKPAQKQIHKEQRGIYNVTYNGKNATMIYKDIESIDNAIAYTKSNRNKGGRHIHLQHSLDSKQQGYINPDEMVNLGKNIRNYISKHGDPHIDKNGSRIYEWSNDKGDKFRAVVNNIPKKEASGYNSRLPAASEEIITFYSNRNLPKDKVFEFKNPKLQESHLQNPQQNALDFSLESSFNRK
ncbi:hypothetical protein [Helicobacter sp. T3_23-1059]